MPSTPVSSREASFFADAFAPGGAVGSALRTYFGFDGLREGQAAALAPVLEGRDALVVMPTGAGKSLVYQLAGLLLPGLGRPGVTLVVSPLIALMKDQVDGLARRGVPVAALHSMNTAAEQRAALDALARDEVRLLYLAPERLRTRAFLDALAKTKVALLAVDEAHCVSQWGHDFRPDYLALADARQRMGNPPAVALTATATPRVQDDIAASLGLVDPARVVTGFNRPNLHFAVRSTPTAKEKREALRAFLDQHDGSAGLIYVSTRKEADTLSRTIRDEWKRPVRAYHAGLPDVERTEVQDAFLGKKLDLVVATNAFGMGVDRDDVRFVAHWAVPSTLEAYYQEAGRAGRDGKPAEAVLFYAPHDRSLREWMIEQHAPSEQTLRALFAAAGREAEGGVLHSGPEEPLAARLDLHPVGVRVGLSLLETTGALQRMDDDGPLRVWRVQGWDADRTRSVIAAVGRRRGAKLRDLAAVVGYAESGACRRRLVLDHFGDAAAATFDDDGLGCCDNCRTRDRLDAMAPADGERPAFDALPMPSRIALGLLDLPKRMRWKVGRAMLVKILTGSRAEGMERYADLPYYGRLGHLGQTTVDGLYKQLMLGGYLRVVGGDRPVVELTALGEHALERRAAIPLEMGASASRPSAGRSRGDDASDEATLDSVGAARFERLRAWRTDVARAQSLPPYVVFDDKTLRALAAACPATEEELLTVKGIGPTKAEKYGATLLELLAEADTRTSAGWRG